MLNYTCTTKSSQRKKIPSVTQSSVTEISEIKIDESPAAKRMDWKKANPVDVSKDMRIVKVIGALRFSPNEWLQPSQISSYFSRLTLLQRKGCQKQQLSVINDEDLEAVLQSIEDEQIRNDLYNSV